MLAQVVRPGDFVLDVGANIGTHAVPLACMVSDSGRVFAFEPQRLVFQNLCANLALNTLTNVYAYEAGVGKEPGWMRLPVFDPRQSFNFAAVTLEGHESGPLAQIMTIDDLKLARCNLIKVFFGNLQNVFDSIQPEANLLCFHKETPADIVGLVPVAGNDDNWRQAIARS